jgi:hypothetical protein
MGIYASRPKRLIGQVLSDVFVLTWGVVWALIGVFINATIGVLATPARETARAAARLAGDFTDAADQAAKVPGVGEQLRRPFDAASVTMGNLIVSANHQVDSIERLALIVGWLVFLIPVAVVVAFWLPRRIRFYRQARASQQFIDSAADLDLFALRAMASQPLYVLAGVSDDPVRDWRGGNRDVINRLAEIELRRNGLRMPVIAAADVTDAGLS